MRTTFHRITEAIAMSGLLFQPHPECGGWKTTRPLTPEVVAFTNKEASPVFDRLAIEFVATGETDENGDTYSHDTYAVVATDRGEYGERPAEGEYETADAAVEAVAGFMETVVDDREAA